MMFFIHIFYLILIKLIFVHTELYTSTTHLTHLLNTEIELSRQLESYLKEEYQRLNNIQKFLDVIKDEIHQAQGKEDYYFGNPVNAYLFIKHLTVDWTKIKNIKSTNISKTTSDNLLFPSYEDYTESIVGLMRLQDTYQLNTSEIASGEISSNFKSRKLTTLECYDLGRVAYSKGDYYHSLMWMQEALDHFNKEPNNPSLNKFDILDYLAFATYKQGNIEHALVLTEEMLDIDPTNVQAKNHKNTYERELQLISTHRKTDKIEIKNERSLDHAHSHRTYERLCRQNGPKLNAKREAKLFCRYRHNNHPYLILQPVKEEQVLDEPAIFVFHDIISDNDIQKIKDLAIPLLKRALVKNIRTGQSQPSGDRVSKSTAFRDNQSPAVARLSRLIEMITNLSLITAEDLQIVNYGIGGHFEPHYDFFGQARNSVLNSSHGDRIATWLTYLSDVEKGGATVFPLRNGYVKPKKGSAAFWYNLYASSEVDYTTRHAGLYFLMFSFYAHYFSGCPVLIGNKWIANKWIHERGQEFRRQCSLDPMD